MACNARCAAVFLLLIAFASAFGQSESDRLNNLLDPLIEKAMRDDPTPGMAVGVVHNGQVVYARGFGLMKLGHAEKPVTTETLFHMASVTKPFVATCVLQLWEQGKVELDSPVVKYLPYFRLSDERYKVITVRQMLSHTSGMPDVEDYENNKPQFDDGALERYVRSLNGQKLLWVPGSKMAYSNMAYEVLGDLIAKVSGMSFEDYAEANIFRPLGMKSTTLLLKKADPAKLADGYTMPRGGDYASLHPIDFYPYNRTHSPSSNLESNVADMTRWALANLNRGELDGKRILKSSTYDLMWKPAADVEFCPAGRECRKAGNQVGLSWFIEKKEGHTYISHSGGDDGFVTVILLDPDQNFGLVMMQNSEHMGLTAPKTVLHAIMDFFVPEKKAGT
jgi:CubicO group peptidase (beta-lactamase class C family)